MRACACLGLCRWSERVSLAGGALSRQGAKAANGICAAVLTMSIMHSWVMAAISPTGEWHPCTVATLCRLLSHMPHNLGMCLQAWQACVDEVMESEDSGTKRKAVEACAGVVSWAVQKKRRSSSLLVGQWGCDVS